METETIEKLLELANRYPSPHNGQPIRLKQTGSDTFEMYFERQRGLQATDVSFIFSFVSIGVFTQHLSYCAQALGHGFSYTLQLPGEQELRGEGAVKFGECKLWLNAKEPDAELEKALVFRQTSRKKYSGGITQELSDKISAMAAEEHMAVRRLSKSQAEQAIWLNQRAVFDDMFDEPVRRELDRWLRYTQGQKQAKQDGLAYDCMELNGRLMKYIVAHPKVLRAPGISTLLKQYYLRTMRDDSDVFYMTAPFQTETNSFNVGLVVMRIWKEIAQHGYYLHPFGTIMSNQGAHRDFLKMAGEQNESRDQSYLVFIFRCGASAPPVPSLRLPYKEHLIMEQSNV